MNKPKTLFLAWQDSNSRSWFPIGRLSFDGVTYQFVYTQGAKEAQEKCGFQPLLSFPRLDEVYTSTHLQRFALLRGTVAAISKPIF